jgi:hypothetical protein
LHGTNAHRPPREHVRNTSPSQSRSRKHVWMQWPSRQVKPPSHWPPTHSYAHVPCTDLSKSDAPSLEIQRESVEQYDSTLLSLWNEVGAQGPGGDMAPLRGGRCHGNAAPEDQGPRDEEHAQCAHDPRSYHGRRGGTRRWRTAVTRPNEQQGQQTSSRSHPRGLSDPWSGAGAKGR